MIRVQLFVGGFAHQPQGSVDLNPVIGLQIGGQKLYLSMAEADNLRASIEKAQADAVLAVENVRASGDALAHAQPAGVA